MAGTTFLVSTAACTADEECGCLEIENPARDEPRAIYRVVSVDVGRSGAKELHVARRRKVTMPVASLVQEHALEWARDMRRATGCEFILSGARPTRSCKQC